MLSHIIDKTSLNASFVCFNFEGKTGKSGWGVISILFFAYAPNSLYFIFTMTVMDIKLKAGRILKVGHTRNMLLSGI